MPQLHPFPYCHHLPPGRYNSLPITRDGIRTLDPQPFIRDAWTGFRELDVVTNQGGRFVRGLCGLIPSADFLSGAVRPHEQLLTARIERQERDVVADGGALGKPVLVTVPSLTPFWERQPLYPQLPELVGAGAGGKGLTEMEAGHAIHWRGDNHTYELRRLRGQKEPVELADFGPVIIADGHHRSGTHAQLSRTHGAAYRFVPVVVMGGDELTIGTFLRVIEAKDLSVEELLRQLVPFFFLTPTPAPATAPRVGCWAVSYRGRHYLLERRRPTGLTDTGWLYSEVLPAVFGITDSRSDPRIESVDIPLDAAGELMIDAELRKRVLLRGFPLPTERFFQEVAAGQLLPPKSTRFEPRVPSGLLVWVP